MKRLLIGLTVIAALGRTCSEVVVHAQEPPPAQKGEPPREEPSEEPDGEAPEEKPTKARRPGKLTRALTMLDEDRPIRPLAGVVVPGSGVAVGAAVEASRLGDVPFGVGGEAMISVRDYRHVLVRAGRLEGRRALPALRAADSSITSMMDEGRPGGSGVAIFAEHRWRHLPALTFFGLDALGEARTDFGVRRTTTDAVVQWRQPGGRVGLSGRVGLLSSRTFAGSNDQHTDTVERFGAILDGGRLTTTRYVTAGAGALVDRRGEASPDGWLAHAVVNGYSSTTAASPSFVRVAIDVRGFRAVGSPRHVLAARVVASADAVPDGGRVPFALQQTLGGTNTLRGYSSYRLRGERLAHVTVESRWQVWRRVDVVPFVDAGGVSRSPTDQALRGLHVAPGIGLRAKHKGRSIGRLDFAWGREGARVSFDIGGPF